MHKVTVSLECGCFKKSSHKKEKQFTNKQEAKTYADSLSEQLIGEFCGKHNFVACEEGDDYIINVTLNPNYTSET